MTLFQLYFEYTSDFELLAWETVPLISIPSTMVYSQLGILIAT